MLHSFEKLFLDAVKPGGLYFLEDLQAARMGPGGHVPDKQRGPFNQDGCILDNIREWTSFIILQKAGETKDGALPPPARGVDRIDHMSCFLEMCVFVKNPVT